MIRCRRYCSMLNSVEFFRTFNLHLLAHIVRELSSSKCHTICSERKKKKNTHLYIVRFFVIPSSPRPFAILNLICDKNSPYSRSSCLYRGLVLLVNDSSLSQWTICLKPNLTKKNHYLSFIAHQVSQASPFMRSSTAHKTLLINHLPKVK